MIYAQTIGLNDIPVIETVGQKLLLLEAAKVKASLMGLKERLIFAERCLEANRKAASDAADREVAARAAYKVAMDRLERNFDNHSQLSEEFSKLETRLKHLCSILGTEILDVV
jgi:hypothetical protein